MFRFEAAVQRHKGDDGIFAWHLLEGVVGVRFSRILNGTLFQQPFTAVFSAICTAVSTIAFRPIKHRILKAVTLKSHSLSAIHSNQFSVNHKHENLYV